MSDIETGADAETQTQSAPFLRVVRGNPTDEELAALVAVVASAAGSSGGGIADAGPRDDWGRPEDRLRPIWGAPGSFTNLRW
ncbi:acyl-CoA carboxylase subunit epsilon [Gordonia sp. Z-3]|uniref:Acyl-CoA carboxylase subunit epsilon n=2 Tax=Gordonia TaxID=2053 RepID=A0A9X3D774_9ACTN|nr:MULTISPECIES: acyl-CoA carboxylase subunit epsilon [Gordonia]MCF3939131.1 acyl-CoA carboxylase subunit epsilon [Gordonia tangerina]MCX2964966.1 acyl-CoA carboxylase subunit epsilon [Gordonia aquimaris]MED5801339.1 acyl-CoA carboxylase subunit epsilon [Gordonia sp. Z-3]